MDKKVDFAAGSDVISLTLDVQSEKEDTIKDYGEISGALLTHPVLFVSNVYNFEL